MALKSFIKKIQGGLEVFTDDQAQQEARQGIRQKFTEFGQETLPKFDSAIRPIEKPVQDFFKPTENVRFRDVARQVPGTLTKGGDLGIDIVGAIDDIFKQENKSELFRSGVKQTLGALELTASRLSNNLRKLDLDRGADFILDQPLKDFENTFRALSEENFREAREISESIERFSFKDPETRQEAIAQSVVQNAPNLIGGVLVGLGAAPTGPVGVSTALLGYSSALEGGFARNEAEQLAQEMGKDLTDKDLDKIMVKVGLANGILEALPVGRLIGRAGQPVKREILKKVAREIVQTGAEESTTEFLQQTVNNIALQEIDPERGTFEGGVESAVVGGLTGGGVGGVTTGVVQTGREVAEAQRSPEAEAGFARIDPRDPEFESLFEEARKYRSAEEFANAPTNDLLNKLSDKGIRGAEQRRQFWETANVGVERVEVLDNLNPTGGVLVEYTPEKRMNAKLGENITTLAETMGKSPDETITIYRGAPKIQKEINPGDFITTSIESARGWTGEDNILQKEVRLGDIIDDKTEPLGEDYIYRPGADKELQEQANRGGAQPAPDTLTAQGLDRTTPPGEAVREGFRAGKRVGKEQEAQRFQTKLEQINTEKDISKRRRQTIRAVQQQFGLTDSELRSISQKDPRFMSNFEFKQFIDNMRQKAVEIAETKQAKNELVDLINRMEFQRLENYRRAKELPPVSQMNATQMREYAEALEQFEVGDEFLTQRQLEVVDRTNLEGVMTIRQAKERLVKEINKNREEPITIDDLNNLNVSAFDNFRGDKSLAEKNPFYAFVVERTQAHILNGEANFLEVQEKINELAKKANKSRKRGLKGTIAQAVIPKHEEIVQYLEAPVEEKDVYAEHLTPEELEYANFISDYYSDAYEHLVSIKELYGSRFVDQYFTHTRRTFLETLSEDGVIQAFKEAWTSHKQDQQIANIIDQDTGNILPKAKFFQYTLQRTSDLTPSKNVTRVFLQYARIFERKKMFDQMIPEIDIYTDSLAPKELTPRGLEMDRKLKTFINKYLNNKKGRRETFGGIVKQNGPADIALRMGNTFVSLFDLGLNIGASVAATVGEQVMTYQGLGKKKYAKAWKRRVWDTGLKRSKTKNGQSLLKSAEPFIGRNIWTELAEPDKGLGERVMQGIFGAFAQSSVEANKLFLLGTATKEEIEAGKISDERLAQLRLEAARWRDLGSDLRSIVGSTSFGSTATKYKGWAIPILSTTIKDVRDLSAQIKNKEFREALTSREAAELYRAIELSTILVMLGSMIIADDDDEGFVSKLRARIYREAMTFLGGIDPTLFLSTPRLYNFLQQLAENLVSIAKLEQYQTTTRWGDEGDLKGLRGLQRQFTPNMFEQFEGGNEKTGQTSGVNVPTIEIPSIEVPTIEIPEVSI